jgi:transporter family-2 protein
MIFIATHRQSTMSPHPSFMTAVLAGGALIAGALVPFQAGSNATLGRVLGHPLWATVVSLLVSLLIAIPMLIALRASPPVLSQTAQMPAWIWFGGIAGVVYITAALVLTPTLGVTRFMASVVAGQMLSSLLIDHFGWMGLPVKPANPGRIAGVMLIFFGMLLAQWTTTGPGTSAEVQPPVSPPT